MSHPTLVCLDLEGVLIPEIWIQFAEKTGIEELKVTTREISDYSKLMKHRLDVLAAHQLRLSDIQSVIATMKPFDGASTFLTWLRERCQVIILSDTFSEFALPFMRQLSLPTIFCHQLDVDDTGHIRDVRLRLPDQKRQAVRAFKNLNYFVMAAGDAYNDTHMLKEADAGFFFRPPANIVQEFPQFPVTHEYDELQERMRIAGGLRSEP